MEDITDLFKEEIKEIIILQKNEMKLCVDKIIPEFNIKILENLRYFEVNSISDLKNNCEELSNLSSIKLSLKNNYDKNDLLVHMRRFIYNNKHINLIGREFNHLDSWLVEMNLNLANIQGVYLENIKNIEGRLFKAVEFDTRDIYNEKIRGMFVYFNKNGKPEDNYISKKQLEKLLLSSNLDSFDLGFKLFSKNIRVGNIDYIQQSGEKLYVMDIWGSDWRNKEEDHIPIDSNILSSPLVLV